MYTSFYNLKLKPFQISSDPAFIWLGEKHKEALATLTYGVLDNKGFMLLTGDVGTGKTTLINRLINGLSDDILYASVPDPRLGLNDFLNYIASAFNIRKNFKTKGKFLIYFKDFLLKAHENNRKVLLLIDEAQLLTQNMLEEIRLLSNIQKDGNNLLNIFFVGQDEFNEILERTENRAVTQRLTLNYHLAPLTQHETASYIQHRLKVAGTTEKLFDEDAIREIQAYSGGFPRRINIICDHCLLTGFVKEQRVVDAEIVRTCAHDLKIPEYTGHNKQASRPVSTEQPDVTPAPVSEPVSVPVYPTISIPVQPTAPMPPPSRPLPRRRPNFFRNIFSGALLLAVAVALLFYLDRATFNMIYDEASQRLISIQHELNRSPMQSPVVDPLLLPAEATVNEPVGAEVQPAGSENVQKPVPAYPGKLQPKEKVDVPGKVSEENQGDGIRPLAADAKSPGVAWQPGAVPAGDAPSQITSAQVASVAPAVGNEEAYDESSNQSIPSHVPEPPEADVAAQSVQVEKPDRAPPGMMLPKETVIVRFDNDFSEFYFTDIERVDDFVDAIKNHPDAAVVISGHTDALGSEGYNYRLSLFRANMLKSFFLGKGIPSHQLKVRAFGSEKPLASNDTAEGRSMNRRVEIDVLE